MTSKTAQELAAAFGYLYSDEVDALQKLALMLNNNPLAINIGAGSGTSALALLESRPDLRLVTVDKQFEGSPLGSIEGEQTALKNAGLLDTSRYMAIDGDSKDVGKYWSNAVLSIDNDDNEVDLVFVDGDHSYEGCRGDIEAWLPHIKHNGIMALHDFKAGVWPGVHQAVHELLTPVYEQILQVQTVIAFRIVKDD